MNKFFKLCLAPFMATAMLCIFGLGLTSIYADVITEKCGDELTYTINEERTTVTITGTGAMDNYTTTTSPFYEYRDTLTTLVLQDGITSIGNFAFYKCSGLTGRLTIPGSVTSIGYGAFWYCSGFTGDLIIPDSVTFIGESAFEWCTGFNGKLTISKSITRIEEYAFKNCSGFTGDLIIPDSVTTIIESAFYECSGFDGKLVIPDSVTNMECEVFSGCSSLTEVSIGKSLTEIDSDTFSGCIGLKGNIVIPASVTRIWDNAFNGCSNLDYIDILNKDAKIDTGAFNGVSTLRCFIGSTADSYSNSDGSSPAKIHIQEQGELSVSIDKPTDGKWIQRIDLVLTRDGREITAPLTQYKDGSSNNYIFPIYMYANSYIDNEAGLPCSVRCFYNYSEAPIEVDVTSADNKDAAEDDGSGSNPTQIYCQTTELSNAAFTLKEVQ